MASGINEPVQRVLFALDRIIRSAEEKEARELFDAVFDLRHVCMKTGRKWSWPFNWVMDHLETEMENYDNK
jgi:hypothetical protein